MEKSLSTPAWPSNTSTSRLRSGHYPLPPNIARPDCDLPVCLIVKAPSTQHVAWTSRFTSQACSFQKRYLGLLSSALADIHHAPDRFREHRYTLSAVCTDTIQAQVTRLTKV
jgi:hypothetical protein